MRSALEQQLRHLRVRAEVAACELRREPMNLCHGCSELYPVEYLGCPFCGSEYFGEARPQAIPECPAGCDGGIVQADDVGGSLGFCSCERGRRLLLCQQEAGALPKQRPLGLVALLERHDLNTVLVSGRREIHRSGYRLTQPEVDQAVELTTGLLFPVAPPPEAEVELVNLTPHEVRIDPNYPGAGWEIDPAGPVPRVSYEGNIAGEPVCGVPVAQSRLAGVVGLPEPKPGRAYIVSQMVAAAAPNRPDLYYPDGLVRDNSGRPIGCRRLGQIISAQGGE